MSKEDNTFVLPGPEPIIPLPENNLTLGTIIFESLLADKSDEDAMVDVFTGKAISYNTILEKSCNLAEALRKYGYANGAAVAICSENSLEFFIPIFASIFVGNIVAPVNHHYTSTELVHTFSISKPKIVFCSENISTTVKQVKNKVDFIEKIVIIDSDKYISGTETLEEFVKKAIGRRKVDLDKFQPVVVEDSNKLPAFILCSSGTTGLPKGVLLSHRNFVVRLQQSRDPRIYNFANNVVIGMLPFFHGYGLSVGIDSIVNKNKIMVFRRFEEDVFLRSIQDYKISVLLLAPPLAIFLAKSPKVKNYDLSCVTHIVCGAAPLGKETELELGKLFKQTKAIRQGYGLTEATLAITALELDEYRPGSCGRTIIYMTNKIRDPETGKSLGPNQVGEICTKGPLVMMGYYNDEAATRESFTSDGWLRTGDLGYYDNDGYFYIVDRLKELIKYKGFQVAPAELEAIILNHPKVLDVGVVGVPDELAGELPLAFVVKKEGVTVTEKEIQDYVAGLLSIVSEIQTFVPAYEYADITRQYWKTATYLLGIVSPQKRLRGGVIFVTSIPKNPSGKILRRELRQQLQNYKGLLESKL